MKNYIKSGDVLTLVAPYAVVSGAGLLVGFLFGVAQDDAASGAAVEAVMEGLVDLAKDTSTFSQGDKVYWDNSAKAVTSTSTSNKLVGYAAQAQLTGDTTCRVYLPGLAQ